MKEAIQFPGPTVKIIESPIPKPNDDQVLIKVVISGANPKDWQLPDMLQASDPPSSLLLWAKSSVNQGDDIAGFVEAVGVNVVEFKPGDRVAAFHEMCTPGGSYAEYALAWSNTTFHIPKKTTFEEAATIPATALTATLCLYKHLQLPMPWTPARTSIPLIIYGASSAVGAFAIKLARLSNIHPIIAIAGSGSTYVETLLDRSEGDTVIDYRNGVDATLQMIQKSLSGRSAQHALDAVPDSGEVLRRTVASGGHINFVLPTGLDVSPAHKSTVHLGAVHNQAVFGNSRDWGFLFSRYFTRALEQGLLSGHPFEVWPGGLEGVEPALRDLTDGKASAVKYLFRIADTPGVSM